MSCWCEGNRRMRMLEKMRNLAKVAAMMEECVFVVARREDGSLFIVKDGEEVKGEVVEYVYP